MALGLADLVAGDLAGEPRSRGRAGWGIAVAILAALTVCWVTGLAPLPSGILLVLTSVGCGWIPLRLGSLGDDLSRKVSVGRHWWALGVLSGALTSAFALSGFFKPSEKSLLWQALKTLDVPGLAEPGPKRFLLFVGSLVFLVASTNGIVRSVLAVAGTQLGRSEQQLRGGRLIGPLERLLIYGFAVAGQATAAALIVSAKSLLRFPELSRVAKQDDESTPAPEAVAPIDSVTEYFLLGSLASWFVALALALLIHEP